MLRPLPGLTLDELSGELMSRARAVEVLRWLYAQATVPGALPDRLPGVSQRAWSHFTDSHGLCVPVVRARQTAPDGTVKYGLDFQGATVEAVRIPARGRSTICVSSQAGCTRACAFCATKELGFTRHLQAEEMVAQYLLARAEAPPEAPASNVVFMGMGEPFDNLDEVLRAVQVLTQGPAPQLRQVSVTVSTSGVLPGLVRFLRESRASLALSLNATTDEVRSLVMPHNRTWPIAALLGALRADAARGSKRETFVEYVLFDGVNDGDDDADRLVELLAGLPTRVNLIPYNPYPGTSLRTPPHERVLRFHQRVVDRGQLCLVRWPRGREIAAACGQLIRASSGEGFAPPEPS
jgi:23S rRNA (adenine2503-C2)-methyltransferase